MKYSRYNFLTTIDQEKVIFNTRTSFFSIVNDAVFAELQRLKYLLDFSMEEVRLSESSKEAFIKSKVFVQKHEDDYFFSTKKFLYYKNSFAKDEIGLVIAPTFACNFKCVYCYEHDLPTYVMNEATQDRLLEFVKQHQTEGKMDVNLCWHGGEPLLAFDCIKRLLTKMEDEPTIHLKSHAMVSNGYLLDDEKCHFLKEHNLDLIQITIDGREVIHDNSRIHKSGKPTYHTILENVERVFRIMPECQVVIRVNVHAQNKEDFPMLYKELSERWKGQNFMIQMTYAGNDGDDSCKVECFPERERYAYLHQLYKEYGIKDEFLSIKPQKGGCTASCINTFVIGPWGEIYKCWVDVGKKDKVVGNIHSDLADSYLVPVYTVDCNMFDDPKCQACTFAPMCDGGCILRRYNEKYNDMPYDFCAFTPESFAELLHLQLDLIKEKKRSKL